MGSCTELTYLNQRFKQPEPAKLWPLSSNEDTEGKLYFISIVTINALISDQKT